MWGRPGALQATWNTSSHPSSLCSLRKSAIPYPLGNNPSPPHVQAYLMFGDLEHLDMFAELYVATQRHMLTPGTLKG